MLFFFTFGLSEIVDSSHHDFSVLWHHVIVLEFEFIEVELSNGTLRQESIVRDYWTWTTYPLQIPRTFHRKVFWIELSHAPLLWALTLSRPSIF